MVDARAPASFNSGANTAGKAGLAISLDPIHTRQRSATVRTSVVMRTATTTP